jgi:hypothetical protein
MDKYKVQNKLVIDRLMWLGGASASLSINQKGRWGDWEKTQKEGDKHIKNNSML